MNARFEQFQLTCLPQNYSQVGSQPKRARLDNQLRHSANSQRNASMQNLEYNMMHMGEMPLDPLQANRMSQVAEIREAEQQRQYQARGCQNNPPSPLGIPTP